MPSLSFARFHSSSYFEALIATAAEAVRIEPLKISLRTTALEDRSNRRGGGESSVASAAGYYQSAYFVPSIAVPSDPLFTSYTPGVAFGLVGSGSDGTVCHESLLFVNGSCGIFRT